MKWLKMGFGHLFVLPFLLFYYVSGAGFLVGLANQNYSAVYSNGVVALMSGGIVGGLLFYLWAYVWPDSSGDAGTAY